MEGVWWVTVVRAWAQENAKSGLLIRMINSFGESTDDRMFASIDEALAQLRRWLEELVQGASDSPGDVNDATR
jgi:hypothetical protein